MKAIIISIGDELVLGQTVDTNSAWLSQQLAAIGMSVVAHATVGDDQAAIERAIRSAAPQCDVLIISGGIGPTPDDLTRQALAEVLGQPLELNEHWLNFLRDFFKKRNREMPDMNKIQAMIPCGAKIILNTCGTAAGIHSRVGNAAVFVVPGVPSEMTAMFIRDVLPELKKKSGGGVILSRTLHSFGLGESAIAEMLGNLMDRKRNPTVGTTVANGIVSVRINSKFDSKEEASKELTKTESACRTALGDLIFGADDQTLPQVVAALLKAQKQTVTTAESCTGGLLAKFLTDIAGSSVYFKQGFITYANEAKQSMLNVPLELLQEHGAVSEPVVKAMAASARRIAKADWALAISGIAGPDGGTETKPVGTVCISLTYDLPSVPAESRFSKSDHHTRTFIFPGDREMIRDRSAKMALTMLRFHLLGKPLPF